MRSWLQGNANMPDNATLSDLNISSQNNTVESVSGYPLYVRTLTGKLINLDASPEETAGGSLKSYLAFWEGVPVNQQRLMFNGNIGPMDDNRTLKHYSVPKGGVVHLNPDKYGIYIRKPDGTTVLVNPHPNP